MKAYWDSSALVKALHDPKLRTSLKPGKDGTRPHSLAELFSTLTKGVNFHYSPNDAAAMLESLSQSLDFVELSAVEAVSAIKSAGSQGVRGARGSRDKISCNHLFTLDEAGFSTLKIPVPARAP